MCEAKQKYEDGRRRTRTFSIEEETVDEEFQDSFNNLAALMKDVDRKFTNVVYITRDFKLREDLAVTSLREFFEIFILSMKKENSFHKDILHEQFTHFGLTMDFGRNSQGYLRIFIATEK